MTVMKIGCILTTFPCRTETFVAREIKGLRELGFDITVLAATSQQCGERYAGTVKILYRPSLLSTEAIFSIGYMFIRYPLALGKLLCLTLKLILACPRETALLIGNLHTIGFFARYLNREKIFHTHAYFLSWPATIGLALSIITGRSFSISAHARDIFVEHGAMTLKVSQAKFITACTQQGLNYLKANLPTRYHHKLHLSYHGTRINIEGFELNEKDIHKPKMDETIIAVGRLVPKKGFGNLLKAFAPVVRERPQCKLIIVGEGREQERLSGLVKQLALKDCVRLVGWKESDVTLRLIKQATAVVVPSVIADDGDRDGIPNVILEAFVCGTPVIASSLEGINEVVKHRQNGLLVEPADVKGLTSAIKELLDNRHLQAQLSRVAYETVVRRFDSVKNVQQLAKLFIGVN